MSEAGAVNSAPAFSLARGEEWKHGRLFAHPDIRNLLPSLGTLRNLYLFL